MASALRFGPLARVPFICAWTCRRSLPKGPTGTFPGSSACYRP